MYEYLFTTASKNFTPRPDDAPVITDIQRTESTCKDDNGKSAVEVSNYPKTDESDRYIIITDSCIETIQRIRLMNMKGEYLFQENKKRIRANALRRALYRNC